MSKGKKIRNMFICLLAAIGILGTAVLASDPVYFSYHILEHGATSAGIYMKNAGVIKAKVQVDSTSVPGMVTNFIIAQPYSGTQVTYPFTLGAGAYTMPGYNYNGVSYVAPNFNETLRGNATATGFGYIVTGYWWPNWV